MAASQTPLIAHNIDFDLQVLARENPRSTTELAGRSKLDTLPVARSLNCFPDCRLSTIAAFLQLEQTGTMHRALADASAVRDFFLYTRRLLFSDC